MNNIADDIPHAYQDGFNDGVRSVFSKTGFFLVKDEKVYAVDMPYEFKYQKSVDMLTGEVHYPTNRMWLRGMTDEELAIWLADPGKTKDMFPDVPCYIQPSYVHWFLWLREEAKGDADGQLQGSSN